MATNPPVTQPVPPAAADAAAAPTTEQKVLQSIEAVAGVAAGIAASFGHSTIGGAINAYASLAPVFAGLFDSIKALWSHHQQSS